jgi:hypothetical protein
MERQQPERHPVRHLQLEMSVMLEAIRVARENQSGDEGRARRARQPLHEHVCGDSREPKSGQQQEVVRDDRMYPDSEQRRRRKRGENDGVRERQCQTLRIKDVGVEQVCRIGYELLQHPGDPPHGEQGVSMVEDRVRLSKLVVDEDRKCERDAE